MVTKGDAFHLGRAQVVARLLPTSSQGILGQYIEHHTTHTGHDPSQGVSHSPRTRPRCGWLAALRLLAPKAFREPISTTTFTPESLRQLKQYYYI